MRGKQAAKPTKPKRRSKAVPVLGAAGLSLALASGAAAATGTSPDMPTRNAAVSHEIALAEEEISDVSLGTFYVFGKEDRRAARPGGRLAIGGACGGCGCGCGGCGGCWTGTNYTSSVFGGDAGPPPPAPRPHKHTRTKHR